MPVLLHLSDTHLDGEARALSRLQSVLARASVRHPDAVVVTGDLADRGEPAEYQRLADCLDPEIPWLVVPGNHDDPVALARTLPARQAPLELPDGTRVIGLDVTVPGGAGGHLSERAAEQARTAAAGAARVILAMHHPPALIGHAFADSAPLDNPHRLAALFDDLPTVLAVLCGHVHTPAATTLAGVRVLVAPGVVSTLRTDAAQRPVVDLSTPPGFALHHIDDGVLTSTFHFA